MNKIKARPFVSLAIVSMLVALGAWSIKEAVNPVVTVFVLLGTVLLTVNILLKKKQRVGMYYTDATQQVRAAKRIERNMSQPSRARVYFDMGLKSNIMSPSELEQLAATNSNIDVLTFVALNPNTPASVLQQLATRTERGILTAVAANPHTPASLKSVITNVKLAETDTAVSQDALLENGETSGVVLRHLYENPYDVDKVNTALLVHPNTPADVFDSVTSIMSDETLVGLLGSVKVIDNAMLWQKLGKRSFTSEMVTAVLSNPDMNAATLKGLDLYERNKQAVNMVARESRVSLNASVLAYLASVSPVMKPALLKRLKSENPEYSALDATEIFTKLL